MIHRIIGVGVLQSEGCEMLERVSEVHKILVVQTAFLGDVILTLPLIQVTKKVFPQSIVDVLTTPATSTVLYNHPSIRRVVVFDKRGKDRGIGGLAKMSNMLREERYDVALVPHRSLRSALLMWLAHIPIRVGFHISAGRLLLNRIVEYRPNSHEIERNISLLEGLGVRWDRKELPSLYPSSDDSAVVDAFLRTLPAPPVAIAPGTVWNTKRWLQEGFAELAQLFVDAGNTVVLIGGEDDFTLCEEIRQMVSDREAMQNAAGRLSFLQSAELLRRCRLLVCNDSAPTHLAVAVRTPVVAIFGATVPEFGFSPQGEHDVVVETKGLACRPCSIHGGKKCPIRTFVCMKNITAQMVYEQALGVLQRTNR